MGGQNMGQDFEEGELNEALNDFIGQFFPGSRTGSRSNSRGQSGQNSQQQQIPEIEQIIVVTLEELYSGVKKIIPVQESVIINGRNHFVERTFEIDIQRGWKAGTKIMFSHTRNFPVKVTFTLQQSKHKFIERRGDDLYWKCSPLDKKKIKKGVIIRIPNVDGLEIVINTKNLTIKHGSKQVFKKLGMPITKNKQKYGPGSGIESRGDFIVKFQIS